LYILYPLFKSEFLIPTTIHYCWFGKAEIPEEYQHYIKEWENFHPGWTIQRWDEDNSPVDNPYLKNAIAKKQWSNCSNFIRLYSLLTHGGIYLDTDVKLLKPLQPLLENALFAGFEEGNDTTGKLMVNNAVMGAIPNHPFVRVCMNELVTNYPGDESSDLSGPGLTTNTLSKMWGLRNYGYQTLEDGIVLYPTEYFYPVHVHNAYTLNDYTSQVTENTYAVHMWGRSWVTREKLVEIVDYLNFKTGNQEKYISDLEKKVTDLDQKSAEIFHWKEFYENSYNQLKNAPAGMAHVDPEKIQQEFAQVDKSLKDLQARFDDLARHTAEIPLIKQIVAELVSSLSDQIRNSDTRNAAILDKMSEDSSLLSEQINRILLRLNEKDDHLRQIADLSNQIRLQKEQELTYRTKFKETSLFNLIKSKIFKKDL